MKPLELRLFGNVSPVEHFRYVLNQRLIVAHEREALKEGSRFELRGLGPMLLTKLSIAGSYWLVLVVEDCQVA